MPFRHFIFAFIFLLCCGHHSFSQTSADLKTKRLDSLFNELKKNHHDTTLSKINFKIGHILAHTNRIDSSRKYFCKAIDLGIKSNFEYSVVRSYSQLGYIQYDLGDMDSSLHYFHKAISFLHTDHPDYFDIYSGLATVYFFKGDNIRSYEFALRSLKVAELSGKPNLIAKSYGSIGVALKEQLKLDDALVFFKKALEIAEKNKLVGPTYMALTNIGNIYSDKFTKAKSRYDVETALSYYLQAKEIVMELTENEKDRSNAVILLGNIGNTYADIHDFDKALGAFKEALDLMNDNVFFGSKSMLYNNLATIYIETKKVNEAEKYLKLAKQSAYDSQSPSDLLDNYKNYALFSELKGDYKSAYLYEFRYKALSDSLFSTEVAEKRKEIELNAEFAKKEAIEKEQQGKKEALAKEEKHRQLLYRNALIIGFILMGLVAFLIFRSYRIKQKSNDIITKQKQEVEQQKELVEAKQKEILDSIHYAKRIQQSLMPTNIYIDKNLNKLKDKK